MFNKLVIRITASPSGTILWAYPPPPPIFLWIVGHVYRQENCQFGNTYLLSLMHLQHRLNSVSGYYHFEYITMGKVSIIFLFKLQLFYLLHLLSPSILSIRTQSVWETSSSQWQYLRPLGHQGRPGFYESSLEITGVHAEFHRRYPLEICHSKQPYLINATILALEIVIYKWNRNVI